MTAADRLAEIRRQIGLRWALDVYDADWLLQQLDAAQADAERGYGATAELDRVRNALCDVWAVGVVEGPLEQAIRELTPDHSVCQAENADLRARLALIEQANAAANAIIGADADARATSEADLRAQLSAAVTLLRRIQVRDTDPSRQQHGWALGFDIIDFLAAPATARVVKRVAALEALFKHAWQVHQVCGQFPNTPNCEICNALAAVTATETP